jgi:hypothetical protein
MMMIWILCILRNLSLLLWKDKPTSRDNLGSFGFFVYPHPSATPCEGVKVCPLSAVSCHENLHHESSTAIMQSSIILPSINTIHRTKQKISQQTVLSIYRHFLFECREREREREYEATREGRNSSSFLNTILF